MPRLLGAEILSRESHYIDGLGIYLNCDCARDHDLMHHTSILVLPQCKNSDYGLYCACSHQIIMRHCQLDEDKGEVDDVELLAVCIN